MNIGVKKFHTYFLGISLPLTRTMSRLPVPTPDVDVPVPAELVLLLDHIATGPLTALQIKSLTQ